MSPPSDTDLPLVLPYPVPGWKKWAFFSQPPCTSSCCCAIAFIIRVNHPLVFPILPVSTGNWTNPFSFLDWTSKSLLCFLASLSPSFLCPPASKPHWAMSNLITTRAPLRIKVLFSFPWQSLLDHLLWSTLSTVYIKRQWKPWLMLEKEVLFKISHINNKKTTAQLRTWVNEPNISKKIHGWQASIWKNTQHFSSLLKFTLKPQWETTIRLFERHKEKTNTSKCWWRCEFTGTHTAVRKTKQQSHWKTVCQLLGKLDIHLSNGLIQFTYPWRLRR